MLKDEFERLKGLFHQAAEGKQVKLDEVFALSMQFFQELKEQLEHGSVEDKKQALALMAQLQTHMMADAKKIAEKSGLSEEQLAAFAANPENFSLEQWQSIQESQKNIQNLGEDIVKVVQHQGPLAPKSPPKKSKEGPSDTKSKWIRS